MLNKISKGYGISMEELFDTVKLFSGNKPNDFDKAMDRKLERQLDVFFDHIITDPQFDFGTDVIGVKNIPKEVKIFVIELYEKITGKKYLKWRPPSTPG